MGIHWSVVNVKDVHGCQSCPVSFRRDSFFHCSLRKILDALTAFVGVIDSKALNRQAFIDSCGLFCVLGIFETIEINKATGILNRCS